MEEDSTQQEIGERMRRAAAEARIDPYDIATSLGVRAPTVYRWYKGQSRPANRLMSAFARLVGCSLAYLWTGVDENPAAAESILSVGTSEPGRLDALSDQGLVDLMQTTVYEVRRRLTDRR